jgi:tetratricopeptide (TPR) repeat protein
MKTVFFLWIVFCIGLPLAAQESPTEPAVAPPAAKQESPAVTNAVESGEAAPAEEAKPPEAKVSFFLETGLQYADEGEYEEAERAYLTALEKDPENPAIRFRLSTLYQMMQRYKEAEPILKKLSEEYPDSARVQNNLSWLYATGGEMKNSEKALRHAREAILSDTQTPSLWNTLAEGYYVSGQYDKALRSAEYALELLRRENADEETIRPFVSQYIKIKRAQEALKLFEGTDED